MKNTSNLNVMFFHGKTTDRFRYTISGTLRNNIMNLGIAICSDHEQFNKAKGRTISMGRLFNQRHSDLGGRIQVEIPTVTDGKKEFIIFTEIVSNFNRYTKKKLLKDFGLRKEYSLSEYEQKRSELIKEFTKKLRELKDDYHQ